MHISMLIIWLIFIFIFYGLGKVHWNNSKKQIEKPPEPTKIIPNHSMGNAIQFYGINIDEPLSDFVKNLNNYVDAKNEESKKANKRAAWGYWVASCMAIISSLLELLRVLKKF